MTKAKHQIDLKFPILLIFLCLSSPIHAQFLDDDLFIDSRLGIRLEIPAGWKINRHPGFSSLLAILYTQDTTISLSYTKLQPKETIKTIIDKNNQAIESMGLRLISTQKKTINKTFWQIDLSAKQRLLRQLYFPSGQFIYIFTLSTPRSLFLKHRLSLDMTLATFHVKEKKEKNVEEAQSDASTKANASSSNSRPSTSKPSSTKELNELPESTNETTDRARPSSRPSP